MSSPPAVSCSELKDKELRSIFQKLSDETQQLDLLSLKKTLLQKGLHQNLIQESLFALPSHDGLLSLEDFLHLKEADSDIIERTLKGQITIPDWPNFSDELQRIFDEVKEIREGSLHHTKDFHYFDEKDPDMFGVSVCTVDGQVWNAGNFTTEFPAHSVAKPLLHVIAMEKLGTESLKKHIGNEPSGKGSDSFELNDEGLPHNPLTNAGVILLCALLFPDLAADRKFAAVRQEFQKAAGGLPIHFDNVYYLGSLIDGARMYALAHYMKSVSGLTFKVPSTLEFVSQICSLSLTTEMLSIIGATMASGGICPLTQKVVFQPKNVQNTMSVMYSCGLYQYSGEWAYRFGVPAKCSPSGCLWIIIPNVAGICIYSPRINSSNKMSCRGFHFAQQFIDRFGFHAFYSLPGVQLKNSPVFQKARDADVNNTVELCYYSSKGDLEQVKKMMGFGADPDGADYDGRTPLHLAASEGHLPVVQYLLNKGANPTPLDRWACSPLSSAKLGGHTAVVTLLSLFSQDPNQN